jgi:hypothetical protein
MLSATDTAYPVLKPSPSGRELNDIFTPTPWELAFVGDRTREPTPTVGLKTFQRLGYFVRLDAIPASIVRHICKATGYEDIPAGLSAYDSSTARHRHMVLAGSILAGCDAVRPRGTARHGGSKRAGFTGPRGFGRHHHTAIEELVRQRFELPAFSALMRAARTARATVNRRF